MDRDAGTGPEDRQLQRPVGAGSRIGPSPHSQRSDVTAAAGRRERRGVERAARAPGQESTAAEVRRLRRRVPSGSLTKRTVSSPPPDGSPSYLRRSRPGQRTRASGGRREKSCWSRGTRRASCHSDALPQEAVDFAQVGRSKIAALGSVAEWSIAPVLKTGNGQPFVSSNLTASAISSLVAGAAIPGNPCCVGDRAVSGLGPSSNNPWKVPDSGVAQRRRDALPMQPE